MKIISTISDISNVEQPKSVNRQQLRTVVVITSLQQKQLSWFKMLSLKKIVEVVSTTFNYPSLLFC